MPTDPRKHQKKQERRAAKRKSARHQLDRQKNLGVGGRLAAAAKHPLLDSWSAIPGENP